MFYAIDVNYRFDVINDYFVWSVSTSTFNKYLCDVTGGNVKLIWEIIGYIMTQDTYRKCFFVFQGIPNSGKSTLERLLKKLFALGTVYNLRGMAFANKFALAQLERKSFVTCSDLPDKPFSLEAESVLKRVVGVDEIDTDDKHKARKSFYYSGKISLFTNNPITVKSDHSVAFFNRAVAVPLEYEVHPTMTDKEFDALLMSELDAIATKALYIYLQRYGQPDFIGKDEFRVNAIIYRRDCWKEPMPKLIYDFVKDCFAPENGGRVFTEYAYREFLRKTKLNEDEIYLPKFSHYFQIAARELYGAAHHRASVIPNGNPVMSLRTLTLQTK